MQRNSFQFQDNNYGINVFLAKGTRHRDAMMPIANKVIFTQLNEFNERQRISLSAGNSDTDLTIPCAGVQWVEVTIEITGPTFTSFDTV